MAYTLAALYFVVMHVFPLVGFLLLGRAYAALQGGDSAKTVRYLMSSTYFGYAVPAIHEQTASFMTHVYLASNPRQDDVLRVAEARYTRALALNSLDGTMYLKMADFYARTGRSAQAEVFLKRVVSIYPSHQTYRIMLARFYADQGRHEEAIRTLEESDRFLAQFAPLHQERLQALRGLSILYAEQGDAERSRVYQAHARRLADQIENPSDRVRTRP